MVAWLVKLYLKLMFGHSLYFQGLFVPLSISISYCFSILTYSLMVFRKQSYFSVWDVSWPAGRTTAACVYMGSRVCCTSHTTENRQTRYTEDSLSASRHHSSGRSSLMSHISFLYRALFVGSTQYIRLDLKLTFQHYMFSNSINTTFRKVFYLSFGEIVIMNAPWFGSLWC